MKRVAFATLGCKANQFDTHAVEDQLGEKVDVVDFQDEADVYVVNTCTVTHRGDAEARKLVRRANRANPDARVIVTGCYAQTQPDEVAAVDGVTHVVGNSHKDRVADLVLEDAIKDRTATASAAPDVMVEELGYKEAIPALPTVEEYTGGTRAFVKVQDGCDYSCTFCIITIARGANASVPVEGIVEQLHRLEAQGYQEAVFTGVQIGRYGRDLEPRRTLAQALEEILAATTMPRIRLTSIDPREVDRELIELVAREPRICPHLHIPIQSGDDAILMLMRRNYDRGYLRELFGEIERKIPDCLIGSDVIVGFPGEGPSEFDMTCDFVERWIDHVHVFSYSDRPGTEAARMDDKIPPDVIRWRSRVLRELSDRKRRRFADRLAGTTQEVLVESGRRDGRYLGYTGHYIPVHVAAAAQPNMLAPFSLVREEDGLVGYPAG